MEKKPFFHFVALSTPELPKMVEVKQDKNKFILNGINHKFVKFLLDLYQKSATHKAITKTKANMIAGMVQYDITNTELSDWLKNINQDGESINEVLSKLALDLAISNYGFLQITRNRAGEIFGINHIDFSTVAIGEANEKGVVENYYICNDWSKHKQEKFFPKEIAAYNPNKKDAVSILMVKTYEPGTMYYPNAPIDESTRNYALAEFDISNYHLNNINSGFFAQAIITHFNQATPEEQEQFVRDFENFYSGKNAKKVLHIWSDTNAPKVEKFDLNDSDKLFDFLSKLCREQIAIGHMAVNKQIYAISSDSTLGDRQSIQDGFQILLSQVIKPVQCLIENALNKIIQNKFGSDSMIELTTPSPLAFEFSENILNMILSQDELRAKIGYAPLTEEQQTNLDRIRSTSDINNGQALYSTSIIQQDNANKPTDQQTPIL